MAKKKKNHISTAERRAFIIGMMREQPGRNFALNHLASASGGGKEGMRQTAEILNALVDEGIVCKSRRRFGLTLDHMPRMKGRVIITSGGSVCIEVEGHSNPMQISASESIPVLPDDLVEVIASRKRKAGGNTVIITEVLERSNRVYSGITDTPSANVIFVRTDRRRIPTDICLSRRDCPDLESGKLVSVSIAEWTDRRQLPTGRLVEILGDVENNDAEMHAIMTEFNLPYRFDKAVEEAAGAIPDTITEKDYAERRDMRAVTTFTIDPDEAKDFDDALSVRQTADGLWEVGVHIADVSHYVTPDSVLDTEARERGTSVYLVDRTVPMLPERLSNGLCSLRPDEEKLCFSAIFTMDDEANIRDEWFGRTVILSNRRFTYGEAQQIIETGKGDFADEVLTLDRLAKIMRSRRISNGALLFDRREARFDLDGEGHPTGVSFKVSKEANHLVEEFMLLANRQVAAFCGKTRSGRPRTMVYRVHDKPDPEKLDKFRSFAALFGLRLKAEKGKALNREINDIMQRTKERPEANAISMMAIRSMAKALYTTDNIGHYGLAFRHYTHFTSPIRRYPDILAHRLLAHYLDGGRSADSEALEQLCVQASEREGVAVEAERASIKYKIAEYMRDRTDEIFTGHISGFADWGMFVELENSIVEGAVHFREVDDDYYWLDSRTMTVTGRMTGKTFTLGDSVRVKVRYVDLHRRILDFALIADE